MPKPAPIPQAAADNSTGKIAGFAVAGGILGAVLLGIGGAAWGMHSMPNDDLMMGKALGLMFGGIMGAGVGGTIGAVGGAVIGSR